MIALFTFTPKFCPNCGVDLPFNFVHPRNLVREQQESFDAHTSFSCKACQMDYQLADEAEILRAARDSGGDLHKYYADVELSPRGESSGGHGVNPRGA